MGKLVSCKECGHEIAESAKVCPNCGAKVKKPVYKRWWFWALLVVIIIALMPDTRTDSGKDTQPTQAESQPAKETVSEPAQIDEEPVQKEPELVIPDDVVYSGSGDDVLTIEPLDGAYVFYITGNAGANHFAVTSYDSAGNYVDLLVNTTDPYNGLVVDLTQSATVLEIKATGDWQITLSSIYNVDIVSAGMTHTGSGDSVFLIAGDVSVATITGNAGANHFAVKAYGSNDSDLLVNTTDPYEGKVLVKCDPAFFVVDSEGDWSITLE